MEGWRRMRKENTRANGREGRGQEGWKKRGDETVGIAREFLSNNTSPSSLSLYLESSRLISHFLRNELPSSAPISSDYCLANEPNYARRYKSTVPDCNYLRHAENGQRCSVIVAFNEFRTIVIFVT